jgi:hypothetical protein
MCCTETRWICNKTSWHVERLFFLWRFSVAFSGVKSAHLCQSLSWCLYHQLFKENSENPLWLNWKTNGTIRKCSSGAFQWMVIFVCFRQSEILGSFCVPPVSTETRVATKHSPEYDLGDRTHDSRSWGRRSTTAPPRSPTTPSSGAS